ncbi:H-NS histone family protein [Burkholderia cenocepacia]|nr:H-NS histone family protein [Burkholderia cenocepacia]
MKSSTRTAQAPVEARLRDPKTGATRSGRGRTPAWINDAGHWNRFLIQRQISSAIGACKLARVSLY